MTAVRYKGRKGKTFTIPRSPSLTRTPDRKQTSAGTFDPSKRGRVEGARVKEVKRVSVAKSLGPEERVARLVKLCHEFGPEKLEGEVQVHERKIADLKAALEQYRVETHG